MLYAQILEEIETSQNCLWHNYYSPNFQVSLVALDTRWVSTQRMSGTCWEDRWTQRLASVLMGIIRTSVTTLDGPGWARSAKQTLETIENILTWEKKGHCDPGTWETWGDMGTAAWGWGLTTLNTRSRSGHAMVSHAGERVLSLHYWRVGSDNCFQYWSCKRGSVLSTVGCSAPTPVSIHRVSLARLPPNSPARCCSSSLTFNKGWPFWTKQAPPDKQTIQGAKSLQEDAGCPAERASVSSSYR